MGNSAGAFTIAALMTRKRKDCEVLFQRAIFESGAPATMSFRSQDSYYPYYNALLEDHGITADAPLHERIRGLKALTSQQLMNFENRHFPFGNYGCTAEEGPYAVFDKASFTKLAIGDWDPSVQEVMIGCVNDEASLSGAAIQVN